MTLDELADFLQKRGLSLRSVTFSDFAGTGIASFMCERVESADAPPRPAEVVDEAVTVEPEPDALADYLGRKEKKRP